MSLYLLDVLHPANHFNEDVADIFEVLSHDEWRIDIFLLLEEALLIPCSDGCMLRRMVLAISCFGPGV